MLAEAREAHARLVSCCEESVCDVFAAFFVRKASQELRLHVGHAYWRCAIAF